MFDHTISAVHFTGVLLRQLHDLVLRNYCTCVAMLVLTDLLGGMSSWSWYLHVLRRGRVPVMECVDWTLFGVHIKINRSVRPWTRCLAKTDTVEPRKGQNKDTLIVSLL